MRLSIEQIEAFSTPPRPVKLHDGHGLFLLVNPDGSRYRRQNYACAGKRKTLSAGIDPFVTIEEARLVSERLRASAAAGIDPSILRKAVKSAKVEALAATPRRSGRFSIDSGGRLTVRLGARLFLMSPDEVDELRNFLNATASLGSVQHG